MVVTPHEPDSQGGQPTAVVLSRLRFTAGIDINITLGRGEDKAAEGINDIDGIKSDPL